MGIFGGFEGLHKKKIATNTLGKSFNRAFTDISKVPVIGDILNSTPLGSAVKTFAGAITGDIKGTLKNGLGLLPGTAGKIGSAVAEFIPESGSSSVSMDLPQNPYQEENDAVRAEELARQERFRTDPVYAKEQRDAWKAEKLRMSPNLEKANQTFQMFKKGARGQ